MPIISSAIVMAFEASWYERWDSIIPFGTHEPVADPVDANITGQRLRRASPVTGSVSVQVISRRPDAEVRIIGHQWNRWRTLREQRRGGR